MNTPLSKLRWWPHAILLALLSLATVAKVATAHTTSENIINIPLGQEAEFFILADVVEEPAGTAYSLKEILDPTVVSVSLPLNFNQTICGSWRIKGNKIGDTLVIFHWKYKDATHDKEEDEVASVHVIEPNGSAATSPFPATGGDPINTRSGEYFAEEATDLSLGGPMPLVFARYHSSLMTAEGLTVSALGQNRSHNFDWNLTVQVPGLRVRVVTDRGRALHFARRAPGKAWLLTGRTDIPYQLVDSAGVFRLADPVSQRAYTFDGTGKLITIEDGHGNTHTLTYLGSALQSIADGLGRTLNFTYASGKLIKVSDQTTRDVDFGYTGSVLTSATDPLGYVTNYAYDGNLLTSFTRPEGNTPFTQIFTDGKVSSQTERTTDTANLSYDTVTKTTTFTDPIGGTLVDVYAATGELSSHTDEAGAAIAMTKDAIGRRSGIVDRAGDATKITYHAASGRPAIITNAEGRVITMTYKARLFKGLTFYDLAKIALPDGSSRSYTYDTAGNLTQLTDQLGKTWKLAYNNRGQALTRTNPTGGVFTSTYDAAGNLTSVKDAETEVTTYGYTANRLTQITRPGPVTVQIVYDDNDRITSITDERGKVYTYTYDTNNRLTGVTDPDTNTTAFAHDSLDRVTQVTDRLGAPSNLAYDARRLLSSFTDRNGNATTFDYDARQRLAGVIDAGSKTWPKTYDGEGLLASMATPVDSAGRIKRNRLGQPIEISTPLGHTVSMARDTMQRLTRVFDPLGRLTTYAYDKRGLLTSATEQGTGTAKYDRDGLGALSKITGPGGGVWSFAYTKAGRLATLIDPLGKKTTRAYDTRGRLQMTTFADATTETLTYDAASNITDIQHTDGTHLTRTYDNLNRLTSTNDLNLSYDAEGRITNTAQAGQNFGASYDAGGRLVAITSPFSGGAFTVTYGYDPRDRLISVADNLSFATVTFAYDDAGRLTSMTRSNSVTATYAYDAAGRLTSIQDGAVLNLQYTLNAAGDITSIDQVSPLVPSVLPAVQSLKFDKASRIITPGYIYDARGRLTTAPDHTFTWDGASRLIAAEGVTLGYDGLGDIITRTAAGTTTRFFHNCALTLHPIVAEKIETGAFVRHYVWTPGGQLLYAINAADNAPFFYHFDHIGSTLALTDAAGGLTEYYAYGPYGEPQGHAGPGLSTQPFTYVGQWGVRVEGSLYHMRARYYDPASARFLSRDPAPPRLRHPKSLNPYQYATDNPITYCDPEGNFPWLPGDTHWLNPNQDPRVQDARVEVTTKGLLAHLNHESVRVQVSLRGSRFGPPSAAEGPAFKIAEGDFANAPLPRDRIIFNWKSVFDEVADFETNSSGAPGGLPQSRLAFKPPGAGGGQQHQLFPGWRHTEFAFSF